MKCSKCNKMISNEYFEVIVIRNIEGQTSRRISEKRYCPTCFDTFGALPPETSKKTHSTPEQLKEESDSSEILQDDIPVIVTKV